MPVPRFVTTPTAGGYMWRLLSGNNRELGRAPSTSTTESDCWPGVDHMQSVLAVATAGAYRTRDGRWAWQVCLEGSRLAISGRAYARQREALYSLECFLAAAPAAAPVRCMLVLPTQVTAANASDSAISLCAAASVGG